MNSRNSRASIPNFSTCIPNRDGLDIGKVIVLNSNELQFCKRGSFAFNQECLIIEQKGSIYSRYKVVDLLGYGTFGEVKKVVNRSTGKIYALKIIKKSCCSENLNLMNEIEILKKLVFI